ncbi:hypothetical protein TOPH_06176 [Tolypocladium ophioglossoides CBS 100239]|uniref:Uncharacterized protein n=1 Tax=Tolypocladium ophioglossoides (strain CBS 100239) TaxID=1163406 RepID=A0A0L0N550_TOLOC|nr:hypothetical protein TOPH_06176 [Tolypocladium ophioglossoides CBS 100239]
MPSTIPYDPQLVLANIVGNEALDLVKQISDLQGPVDSAQEELSTLLASRRSLDMTKTELLNLGITTKKVDESVTKLNDKIEEAASKYADEKVTAEEKIQPLRAQISRVHIQMESPVDYVKSQIKSMPLASDSINMDVQYFSLDTNQQDASSFAGSISSYVSASMSWLGKDVASQMSNSASQQVSDQTSKHSISGTLVLSVSCTHKNASVLAPFVLNVDKAIKVWNHLFKDEKIVPTSTKNMMEIANQDDPDGPNAKKFSIISGMTFGSSFVGMVHILNTSSTSVSEKMTTVVTSLQAQMDAGAWFSKASGGFGVNTSIANDVKNMLSSQNINSHVTLICMGAIPSMVANEVKLGVEKFANFDPKSSMAALATLQNATVAGQETVKQSADAARTGGQMVSMKAGELRAALSALAEIDDGSNKILDINSMMTALEDYLKKAADGTSGIPVNYYLKDITKGMLAEMWVAKYYPGKYMAITYDDVEPKQPETTPA